MSLLTIRLFGDFSVSDHRGNTLAIGHERTRALIAWLALHLTDVAPLREFAQQFGQDDAFTLARDLRYTLRFIASDAMIGEGESLRFNRHAVDVDAIVVHQDTADPERRTTAGGPPWFFPLARW